MHAPNPLDLQHTFGHLGGDISTGDSLVLNELLIFFTPAHVPTPFSWLPHCMPDMQHAALSLAAGERSCYSVKLGTKLGTGCEPGSVKQLSGSARGSCLAASHHLRKK